MVSHFHSRAQTSDNYNAANMLLSTGGYGASGFQNDADGNTLVGNGRTNTWDSQNRLASCVVGNSTTSYTYGADGLRRHMFTYQQFQAHPLTHGATSQDVTLDPGPALDIGTSYAYDGTMLVREGHTQTANGTSSLPSANVTATYFIGARGPEYRRDDTQPQTDAQGHRVTKARWYVYDGLGSVVGEVDPLGNLTSSPKYDVYGAVRANGGTATSKQGFVGGLGHVSDDTGLVYMRARYMDPQTGRFVSEDPGKQGPNWFAYCHDNPVRFTDQSGKAAGDWVMLGDGLLTLGFQAALFCQFLIAIHSTEDSSDVEEDWNKFCEGYKQADPLFGEKNERGDEEDIVISTYLGAKGATEEGSLSGGMMTIASGATAGAGLAVLIYGYEARVNWYAGRCDGD